MGAEIRRRLGGVKVWDYTTRNLLHTWINFGQPAPQVSCRHHLFGDGSTEVLGPAEPPAATAAIPHRTYAWRFDPNLFLGCGPAFGSARAPSHGDRM